jgi:hypothetical protein
MNKLRAFDHDLLSASLPSPSGGVWAQHRCLALGVAYTEVKSPWKQTKLMAFFDSLHTQEQ